MATMTVKVPRERKPGPYAPDRRCEGCGAKLSHYNGGNQCAPCSGGDWLSPDQLSERRALKLARGRVEGLAA